jgi:hypothetical protein
MRLCKTWTDVPKLYQSRSKRTYAPDQIGMLLEKHARHVVERYALENLR